MYASFIALVGIYPMSKCLDSDRKRVQIVPLREENLGKSGISGFMDGVCVVSERE
jgi:hypothetical protein